MKRRTANSWFLNAYFYTGKRIFALEYSRLQLFALTYKQVIGIIILIKAITV